MRSCVTAGQRSDETMSQLEEALLSQLLRNGQATLAIAAFHGIGIEAAQEHKQDLAKKLDAVQLELAEVEDVVEWLKVVVGEFEDGLAAMASSSSSRTLPHKHGPTAKRAAASSRISYRNALGPRSARRLADTSYGWTTAKSTSRQPLTTSRQGQ